MDGPVQRERPEPDREEAVEEDGSEIRCHLEMKGPLRLVAQDRNVDDDERGTESERRSRDQGEDAEVDQVDAEPDPPSESVETVVPPSLAEGGPEEETRVVADAEDLIADLFRQ